MKVAAFQRVVEALNEAGVHYLVVGGMAVIAHGYLRFTKDVDLVVRLTPTDIAAAFEALAALGYQPGVPITCEQFSDSALREQWRSEKGMVVLTFWSDQHPETPLDLFVYEPFDFAAEDARALRSSDPSAPKVGFASIPALVAMKREVGRPLDLLDVENLLLIANLHAR